MTLPYDAVTVLMVITCVLIYVISYCWHSYLQTITTQYMCLLHNICLHLLRCAVYSYNGVACVVNFNYCIYVIQEGP